MSKFDAMRLRHRNQSGKRFADKSYWWLIKAINQNSDMTLTCCSQMVTGWLLHLVTLDWVVAGRSPTHLILMKLRSAISQLEQYSNLCYDAIKTVSDSWSANHAIYIYQSDLSTRLDFINKIWNELVIKKQYWAADENYKRKRHKPLM